MTSAVLEFKKQVDDGSLEPEYMRGAPIAMSSYWWMFNACRIPAKPADYPVKHSFKEHPYIIAIRKNQFFKIYHEVEGKQLNTSELEQQFRRVYANAEKAPPIGVMTAGQRGDWAQVGAIFPHEYLQLTTTKHSGARTSSPQTLATKPRSQRSKHLRSLCASTTPPL